VIRVFVVYDAEPDPERRAGARTPELAQTGKDATAMGIPFQAHFAEVA
jgi:hypothetical protein